MRTLRDAWMIYCAVVVGVVGGRRPSSLVHVDTGNTNRLRRNDSRVWKVKEGSREVKEVSRRLAELDMKYAPEPSADE